MVKRTMLVLALMALLVGSLMAQPMRHHAQREAGQERIGMNHNMKNRGPQGKMGMNHRQGGQNMKNMQPGRMILAMSEELELTTTQIDNIKTIQASFKKNTNTKQAEVENLLIDKRAAMRDQDFKNATKVTKDIYKIREQIALAHISAMEDIYKELSKDQIAKLKPK
ncbi:hypothetical protein JEZ13_05860 [bacterium]|nr:hypothetical protein [bacterium]